MSSTISSDTVIRLREAAGWDQGELAYRSGLHPDLIVGVEAGRSELPASALTRIAVALGVPPDAIRP